MDIYESGPIKDMLAMMDSDDDCINCLDVPVAEGFAPPLIQSVSHHDDTVYCGCSNLSFFNLVIYQLICTLGRLHRALDLVL